MNNFVLTFPFLIGLFLYYEIVGYSALLLLRSNSNKFGLNLIIGWILTFFVGWISGFPAQILEVSWSHFAKAYKIILFFLLILAIINIYRRKKKSIYIYLKKIRNDPYLLLGILKRHIKQYWFIYLFVGIFTFYSITNLQPYTLNNYLDDSYISKMIHMINSDKIFAESQSSGEVLKSYGKYSLALQQSQRMFNTYELIYSVLANISSIDMVAFVRFTMTIHNYLIWFLSFQLFGSIFVNDNQSQYVITPFILLLIPEGFSSKGMGLLSIRMFENWRNQTAIYMGGSIVRNTAFPLLSFFSYSFYKKRNIRELIIFVIFTILLLSFQTTALSYIILFLPFFVFGLLVCYVYKKFKGSIKSSDKFISINLLIIIFVLMFLFITNIDGLITHININSKFNLITRNSLNYKTLVGIYNQYLPYYNNVFKLDSFMNTGLIVLLLIPFLTRDFYSKIIDCIIAFIFLTFKLNKAKLTLSLISFEFYCTARMLNGVELLIIALYGVAFIECLNKIAKIKKQNLVLSSISFVCVVSTILYMNVNMPKILKYTNAGDGVVKQGYSSKIILENDKMMPQVFVEVGKYFDKQPLKKYPIFSFPLFQYKGLTYTKQYLLFASKKIEFYPDWKVYATAKEKGDISTVKKIDNYNSADFALTNYLQGNYYVGQYNKIAPYVDKSGLKYAFLTEKNYADNLISNGWHVVLGSSKKNYWLLKKNN